MLKYKVQYGFSLDFSVKKHFALYFPKNWKFVRLTENVRRVILPCRAHRRRDFAWEAESNTTLKAWDIFSLKNPKQKD